MDLPARITRRFPLPLIASLCTLSATFATASDEPFFPDPPTPALASPVGTLPPGPFLVPPPAPIALRSGPASSSIRGPFLPDPPAMPGAVASRTKPSASGTARPPTRTGPSSRTTSPARGSGSRRSRALVRYAPFAFDLDLGPALAGRELAGEAPHRLVVVFAHISGSCRARLA